MKNLIKCVILMVLCPTQSVRFTAKPKDVRKLEGHIATLKCFVGDFEKEFDEVSWWKEEQQLSETNEIKAPDSRISVNLDELPHEGEYSYSLLVSNVALADEGEYHCEIHGTTTISSTTAMLKVLQVPSPEYPQCRQSASYYFVDTQVTLTCISELVSPPVHLRWIRKENVLPTMLELEIRNNMVYRLHQFIAKKIDNDAPFVCQQTSEVNDDVNNCAIQNLNIQYSPEVKIQHTDVLFAGSDSILFCQSFANPPVTQFLWTFTPVLNANEYIADGQVLTLVKLSGTRNGTLVTCHAENAVGLNNDTTNLYISVETIRSDIFENNNIPVWFSETEQTNIDTEETKEEVSLYVVIIIIIIIIIIVVVVVVIPVYYQCFCKTRTHTDLSGREIYQPTVYYDTRNPGANSGLYDRSLPRLPSSVHYGHWRHSSASQVPEDLDQQGYMYIEERTSQNTVY